MGRFVEVVAAGVAGAVVLGFAYWGILVLLQPLLDRLRALIHGISKPVADPVEVTRSVTRSSASVGAESRPPMPSPAGVITLTVKRIPHGLQLQGLSHPMDAPPKRAVMTKTLKAGHLVNFILMDLEGGGIVDESKVYPLVSSRQRTEMVKSLKSGRLADFIFMDSKERLIVAEAKVYQPVTSPWPPQVRAVFETPLEARVRAARATMRSTTPAQAEREFLRKFAGKTSTSMVPRRQELTEFSDLGLGMSDADALLSKLGTQMPVPEGSRLKPF